MAPYADEVACHNGIVAWRTAYGVHYTLLCDRDIDGDEVGDVFEQFNRPSCGGVPQNWYSDHNWAIWKYMCGADLGPATNLAAKAYAEWCE